MVWARSTSRVCPATAATAHAAVPQARVLPTPRSQTIVVIGGFGLVGSGFVLDIVLNAASQMAKDTFVPLGKLGCVAIRGAISLNSSSDGGFSITACGFPTDTVYSWIT